MSVPVVGNPALTFISWCHRDPRWSAQRTAEWENLVYEFATLLRANGVDADVDLYHVDDASVDWSRFGPERVEAAQFILLVVSSAYKERWSGNNEPSEGAGAVQEADALKGMFVRDQAEFQRRVKVVLLPGSEDSDIPAELMRLQRFTMRSLTESDLDPLLRVLTGQPRYLRVPLGDTPSLPPRRPVVRPSNESQLRDRLHEVEQQLQAPPDTHDDSRVIEWYEDRARLQEQRARLLNELGESPTKTYEAPVSRGWAVTRSEHLVREASPIYIQRAFVAAMSEQYQSNYPNIVCGLFAGHRMVATDLYRCRNAEASPVIWRMDVLDQLAALREMENRGLDLVAIYSSRTNGPPFPSATDIAVAYYPETVYLYFNPSLVPQVRGFSIVQGTATEVSVEIA